MFLIKTQVFNEKKIKGKIRVYKKKNRLTKGVFNKLQEWIPIQKNNPKLMITKKNDS